MPSIPLRFDPSPSYDLESHLETQAVGNMSKIVWRSLDLVVFHSEEMFPTLDDFSKHTPGLVFHGHFGFSLGQYSEFFIGGLPIYCPMMFGSVEVTFGEPTPLAMRMFETYRDKHFHGEWENINSVRILGCTAHNAELVLLNAFDRYEESFSVLPHVEEINHISWAEPPETDEEALLKKPLTFPAAVVSDIDALRCFYYARTNPEPATACIQYYRVLEYYAFFSLQQTLALKRRDSSLSDRDFLLSTTQLLTRDEKSPIVKLVGELADSTILGTAHKAGFIRNADASQLGLALYEFRNSVVHAKYDQRVALSVDSVVATPSDTQAWQTVLHALAKRALNLKGTRSAV